MTKSNCMLARTWTEDIDPTGWLMSEKLDGIRVIRPAGQRNIVSRKGCPFNPPQWWLDQLPGYEYGVNQPIMFLDGEAWMGRGKFEETQSIIQKPVPVDEEWERIKFRCIEPFTLKGKGWLIFKPAPLLVCIVHERNGKNIFEPIGQIICTGREHLQQFYDEIVEDGGEGVMLRHPKQPYHLGRSPYLLKVKPEIKGNAIVLGFNRDDTLLVSLKCGWIEPSLEPVYFNISNGLTEALRVNPPAIGSEIKFVYQSLTDSGKPRMARLAK